MKTRVLALVLLLNLALVNVSYGVTITEKSSQNKSSQVKAPEAGNGMMIVAKVTIKPEKIKDFIAVGKEMVEKSNKESGCKSYQLYQDPFNSNKFVFVEEYKNQAAIDSHFATDYFKAFGPKVKDLVAEPTKIKIITVAKEVNQ
jgi:quinol monooxygenase YgiN